jgi:hypothetical protein
VGLVSCTVEKKSVCVCVCVCVCYVEALKWDCLDLIWSVKLKVTYNRQPKGPEVEQRYTSTHSEPWL